MGIWRSGERNENRVRVGKSESGVSEEEQGMVLGLEKDGVKEFRVVLVCGRGILPKYKIVSSCCC